MNKLIFVLVIAIFFPMFGRVIPLTAELPFYFTNYSIVFVFLVIIIKSLKRKQRSNFIGIGFLVFGIYYISNLWIKGIFSGYLQVMSAKAAGVMLGSLILILLNQYVTKDKREQFFNKFTFAIGVMLSLQLILSMIESRVGTTLGIYEIKVYSAGVFKSEFAAYGNRDPLLLVGLSLDGLFGFQFPFTGMIGQHNAFGIMLFFYNILFLMHYLEFRSNYSKFLLLVVLVAIIGNTTRTSLILILLSDLIVFYRYGLRTRFSKFLIAIMFIVLSALSVNVVYSEISFYFSKTDTLYARLLIWESIVQSNLVSMNILSYLFGIDAHVLLTGSFSFLGGFLSSLENQYISLLLFSGIIGLVFYIYQFVYIPIKQDPSNEYLPKFFLKMLGLSIAAISITMDNVLHYSSYSLIIILFYLCFLKIDKKNQTN